MKNSRLHSLLRAPAKKKFFTTKENNKDWRGPSALFSFFDFCCCLRVFGSFMLQMIICSEILTSVMSCLRVAEVEREQPGARGNRWNLQEGQEFAEIWPFWRIKLCSKAMGILRDFPLSYQTLIRSWVILGKLYVDLSNFWGYFFFWGRVSILWLMVHEVWVGGWPLDSGPVQCFSTAQWVEPHHLWWVLLGLHG